MASLSVKALEEKRFGKRRVSAGVKASENAKESKSRQENESQEINEQVESHQVVAQQVKKEPKNRYISKSMRYRVWKRDRRQCQICGSRLNLQFDHIKPLALGGDSSFENLRLLCFQCNQRAAIRLFGVEKMRGCGSLLYGGA